MKWINPNNLDVVYYTNQEMYGQMQVRSKRLSDGYMSKLRISAREWEEFHNRLIKGGWQKCYD